MAAAPPATRGPRPRRRPPRRGQSGSASGTRLRPYPAPSTSSRIARMPLLPQLRGTGSGSLGRGWHRRGVMVDGLPVVAVLHIGEAVAGRNRFGFTVFSVGERVIATVDRGVSVDADHLVTELDGRLRQRLEGADEVGFPGGRVRPYRR